MFNFKNIRCVSFNLVMLNYNTIKVSICLRPLNLKNQICTYVLNNFFIFVFWYKCIDSIIVELCRYKNIDNLFLLKILHSLHENIEYYIKFSIEEQFLTTDTLNFSNIAFTCRQLFNIQRKLLSLESVREPVVI